MKNHDVVVRSYAPETDLKKLSRIWLDASLLAHHFIGENRLHEQRTLIEDQYLPNAETWVACLGEQPSGFISLLDTFIGGIFVSPDRQGLGIGRLLISHALLLTAKGSRSLRSTPKTGRQWLSTLGSDSKSCHAVRTMMMATLSKMRACA
ncbi:GNAT family N-acetyltransferase [Pelagibacterium montanilacus]|uniref:GNAT family N-acetyltransferase n=1 Tax=Pelagibacterium montanilacus TaxID=2185280 RepID=UPI00319DB2E3